MAAKTALGIICAIGGIGIFGFGLYLSWAASNGGFGFGGFVMGCVCFGFSNSLMSSSNE